ncbi:MAG: hypothetical protein Q9213_002191 [Squamulea squamosa]
MTSQQRNYRPPASTAIQTSLNRHARHDGSSSTTRQLEEAQWLRQEEPQDEVYSTPTAPIELSSPNHSEEWVVAGPAAHDHWEPQSQASPPERSLADRFEKISTASPTTQELSEFHRAVDRECLLRSLNPNANPTLSTGTIVQITLYLSSPLLQWSDLQSGRFRDIQLRALVAALALLHHSGLTKLTADPYDQLRTNIAARFNEIFDGRRASQTNLEDRIRKADALYLIRLAAQYFSLIKRAQPLSDAVPIPIMGLVLAGASIVSPSLHLLSFSPTNIRQAAGQYNALNSVFQYADKVIGLIPGRQSPYLNLPAIQELTRNATTIFATAATRSPQEITVEENKVAAGVVQLVQQLLNSHFQNIPSRRSSAWDWPLARLRRLPPLMDRWYFFFGLLDCVAQLAPHVQPGQLSVELLSILRRLMEESEYEELRWKIIEIFQAYEPTRRDIHRWLATSHGGPNNDNAGVLLELAAVRTIARQSMLTEVEAGSPVSRQTTASSNMDDPWSLAGNATSSTTRPSRPTLGETRPSARRENVLLADSDAIEPLPTTNESLWTNSTDEQGRSLSLASQQPLHTPNTDEADDMDQFLEGDLDYWTQEGNMRESHLLPSRGLLQAGRGYVHAGLSSDCTLAFFYDSKKVCVYPVSLDDRRRRREDVIFEESYSKDSRITDVSLSNNILAVSTHQQLELHQIGLSSEGKVVIPHGGWDPLGLATCQQHSGAMVAVGLRRSAGSSRKGRVVVHQVKLRPQGLLQKRVLQEWELPEGDAPKFLAFDRKGTTLVCITDRSAGSSVIVWDLKQGALEDGSGGRPMPGIEGRGGGNGEAVVIARHQHIPETDSDGLTSVAIYDSPSHRQYLICTTWPSTERFRSKGEWSFSSPNVRANEQVPPRTVHDLTALQDYRQIVASAVSSEANKLSILTKSGDLLLLDLTGHEEGGICSREDAPDVLPASLCESKSSRATPDCLRFDPSGTKLYAVDPEGKLVIVMFRPEE